MLSEIEDLTWRVTYEDIDNKLKMYASSRQVGYVQEYQSLLLLAKNMFGGSEKKDSNAIIQQRIDSLPKVGSSSDVAAWLARNK